MAEVPDSVSSTEMGASLPLMSVPQPSQGCPRALMAGLKACATSGARSQRNCRPAEDVPHLVEEECAVHRPTAGESLLVERCCAEAVTVAEARIGACWARSETASSLLSGQRWSIDQRRVGIRIPAITMKKSMAAPHA